MVHVSWKFCKMAKKSPKCADSGLGRMWDVFDWDFTMF